MATGTIFGLDPVTNTSDKLGLTGIQLYGHDATVCRDLSGMDGGSANHAVKGVGIRSHHAPRPHVVWRGRALKGKSLTDQMPVGESGGGELRIPFNPRCVGDMNLVGLA